MKNSGPRFDPHDTTTRPLFRPPNLNPTFSPDPHPLPRVRTASPVFRAADGLGKDAKALGHTTPPAHYRGAFPSKVVHQKYPKPLIDPGSRACPCHLLESAMRRYTMSTIVVEWFDRAWECLNTRRIHGEGMELHAPCKAFPRCRNGCGA